MSLGNPRADEENQVKRIAAWLGAMALACGLVVAAQSSASATTTHCDDSPDGSTTFCMQYDQDPGPDGFYVYWVRATCKPFYFGIGPAFGWEDIALDGHVLQIINLATQTVKWGVGDTNANVHLDSGGTNQCTRTWWVQEHWASMNTLYADYVFDEQKNNQPDKENVLIDLIDRH